MMGAESSAVLTQNVEERDVPVGEGGFACLASAAGIVHSLYDRDVGPTQCSSLSKRYRGRYGRVTAAL